MLSYLNRIIIITQSLLNYGLNTVSNIKYQKKPHGFESVFENQIKNEFKNEEKKMKVNMKLQVLTTDTVDPIDI